MSHGKLKRILLFMHTIKWRIYDDSQHYVNINIYRIYLDYMVVCFLIHETIS